MMNLELIKEITDLKEDGNNYTQIAEITGLAKTSIVLSLRLSKIFESVHAQQTASYQEEIKHLNASVQSLTNSISTKDTELKKLEALIDIDYEHNILISKKEYHDLKNECNDLGKEVAMLERELSYEYNKLNNLSFIDKVITVFQ